MKAAPDRDADGKSRDLVEVERSPKREGGREAVHFALPQLFAVLVPGDKNSESKTNDVKSLTHITATFHLTVKLLSTHCIKKSFFL